MKTDDGGGDPGDGMKEFRSMKVEEKRTGIDDS
jgi:hypothetical protein